MICLRHLLLGLFLLPLSAWAETLTVDEVEAGFIYNFTKFVTWPSASDTSAPLRLCSTGDTPLSGKLNWLHGREAQGRRIEVEAAETDWRRCHLLYIAQKSQTTALLDSIARLPILTVSDSPGFIQAGGMIGLYLVADRVRFSVNLGAAQRSGLKLSSQLLQLAQEIIP